MVRNHASQRSDPAISFRLENPANQIFKPFCNLRIRNSDNQIVNPAAKVVNPAGQILSPAVISDYPASQNVLAFIGSEIVMAK